jgi:hypothetical protein
MRTPSILLALGLGACGAHIGDSDRAAVDAGPSAPDGRERVDASPAELCAASDLMIVLDRTGSMAQRPDGSMPPNSAAGVTQTKWYAAVNTIEDVVTSYQDTVRFGLALFPRDPDGEGGRDCSNLDTWLAQYLPPESNDLRCQPAEVAVATGEGNAAAIDAAIDVMGTGLCRTTPIGAGLFAAQGALAASAAADRSQFVLLITDGDDNCDDDAGYDTDSLPTADALAAAGIRTHVVGFDGSGAGIDARHLNDLACAGGTAPDPVRNCVAGAGGMRAVAAPSPARLFLLAEDQVALTSTLMRIADDIACDPVE